MPLLAPSILYNMLSFSFSYFAYRLYYAAMPSFCAYTPLPCRADWCAGEPLARLYHRALPIFQSPIFHCRRRFNLIAYRLPFQLDWFHACQPALIIFMITLVT